MKKFILLLCICVSSIASAQIITFPDGNLKSALVNSFPVDTDGNGVGDSKADLNNDGEIDQSEALTVRRLILNYRQLTDLTGIQYFSNLTDLLCHDNALTFLNVSGLTSLDTLDCNRNNLTSLDASGATSLTYLNCNLNQITSLNLLGAISLNYLYCNSNLLTSIDASGLTSLNYLNCADNVLTTLNVSGLSNLNHLECRGNQLAALDVSGLTNLSTLSCYTNQLTALDVSTNTNLINLYCYTNQITSLNVLPLSNLRELLCYSNPLGTLNVSGLTNLRTLSCGYNLLTTLDLTGMTNLISLYYPGNNISNLDLSDLTNLELLSCQSNQITHLDLSGLINLSTLSCNNNQLTTLDVTDQINLYTLNCQNNQLVSLLIKNGRAETVNFQNNPNLMLICCDVSQGVAINLAANSNGLTNCTIVTSCSFAPGGDFSNLQGSAIFDSNGNGCDSLDANFYQLTANITNGIITNSLVADNNGFFVIPVQAGNYTFSPVLPNPNYFTITPSTAQITVPNTNNNILSHFCIAPNGIHHDLEINILPISEARPGFDAVYSLVYKNNGNQIENGSLRFNFDDTVLDFSNASIVPNTTNTGVLTWNFSNLRPLQSKSITITFNCNTPTETPALNVGDTLDFTSSIVYGQIEETPLDTTFYLSQLVVGSYDPNDKTCLEGNSITPEKVGDYVHYLIRFENTGTYAAENIAILDVIDVNTFDISSLQIIASSHNVKVRIKNGNRVEFIFEQINLPFDNANNDGYVAFKIKTLPTLQLNHLLKNKADIYFDYNAPITTNEAQTIVQYPSSTVSLGLNSNSTTLNLYPNPAETTLYIPADAQITQADIFDMKGALVRSVSVHNNQIEVQGLSSGTYFTRLYSDAKLYSAKFMVK